VRRSGHQASKTFAGSCALDGLRLQKSGRGVNQLAKQMSLPVLVKLKGRLNVFVVQGKIVIFEDNGPERKDPSASKTVRFDS